MPLHEYECRGCGHVFELLLRHSSSSPACPSCAGQDLERVISMFAVSSASSRASSLLAARRSAATNPDRLERQRAEARHTVEHLKEDYGITPDKPKPISRE